MQRLSPAAPGRGFRSVSPPGSISSTRTLLDATDLLLGTVTGSQQLQTWTRPSLSVCACVDRSVPARLATVWSGPDRGQFWRPFKKTGLYGPAPPDCSSVPKILDRTVRSSILGPQSSPVQEKAGPDHTVRSKTGP